MDNENESLRLVRLPDGSTRMMLFAWDAAGDVWVPVAEYDAVPVHLLVYDEAGREVVVKTDHVFLGLDD